MKERTAFVSEEFEFEMISSNKKRNLEAGVREGLKRRKEIGKAMEVPQQSGPRPSFLLPS